MARPGTRVTLVDSWMIGRTGHTAFSNAWMIVALPDDDIDGITARDRRRQRRHRRPAPGAHLARAVLRAAQGLRSHRHEVSAATRTAATSDGRPAASISPASCIPRAAGSNLPGSCGSRSKPKGVQLLDRLFVTGLLRGDDDRIVGAVGINSRTGEFHVIKARATIVAHQRASPSARASCATSPAPERCWPIGRARRCATPSSAMCGRARRSSISRASPSRSRKARIWSTPRARRSCGEYEPDWGDEADVPRIARAMAMENGKGNDAALSRHVGDPRRPARVLHPEQSEMDGQFLPQARRRSARPTCSARRRITRSTR